MIPTMPNTFPRLSSIRRRTLALTLPAILGLLVGAQTRGLTSPHAAAAGECAAPMPGWLMCEDFEGGGGSVYFWRETWLVGPGGRWWWKAVPRILWDWPEWPPGGCRDGRK